MPKPSKTNQQLESELKQATDLLSKALAEIKKYREDTALWEKRYNETIALFKRP